MNSALLWDEIAARCQNKLGPHDDVCPYCSAQRKPANRKKKVLRWWLEADRATWCCQHCGEHGYTFRDGTTTSRRPEVSTPQKAAESPNKDIALKIWSEETKPLNGTLGATYLKVRRHIDLDNLPDLSHCLRWHAGKQMIVALMCNPLTGEATGIHRIFLNKDGNKRKRMMLGPKGVICLSPWENVELGLGLSEGIEDGLRILAGGWGPMWAAPDAGSIKSFPVIPGIEFLTVWADRDQAGKDAARTVVHRWRKQGQEAVTRLPAIS